MSLSKELAAVLRSARAARELSIQDLGETADRRFLWQLESGRSSPTLNKFDELAQAVGFEPITLLALCIAMRDGVSPEEVLERSRKDIQAFEAMGGSELLSAHSSNDGLASRSRERARKAAAVQECKSQGLTQMATAEKLGIPRSTVYSLWKLDMPVGPKA